MKVGPRHIHHTKRRMSAVHINNVQIPQEDVEYLGCTLTADLSGTNRYSQNATTTRNHPHQNVLVTRTEATDFSYNNTQTNLDLRNTALGVRLPLPRLQSKALRMTVEAQWYGSNAVVRSDLQTPTAKEEIRRYSSRYRLASAHTQPT
jgi:hypothetical protein